MESVRRSHRKEGLTPTNSRYSYPALLSRVELMFEKAEIDKPDDFYNLRHSSCVLDKMDNLPNDLAAQRHGHSVDFFINVYGRLDLKGVVSRVRKHYGTEAEKQKPLTNIICDRCQTPNEPNADYCLKCSKPLSSSASAKMYEEKKRAEEKLSHIENMLLAMAQADPRFRKFAEIKQEKR